MKTNDPIQRMILRDAIRCMLAADRRGFFRSFPWLRADRYACGQGLRPGPSSA